MVGTLLSTSFNSGVSIEVVRRRLGHASTETTQIYTLLADKVADTEIRAARRKRETLTPMTGQIAPKVPCHQPPKVTL